MSGSAFKPRTDTMLHFIHDVLHGVGGLRDLVRSEMPFPKCGEQHDQEERWWCDAAEWVLVQATRHPEIMQALNERAATHVIRVGRVEALRAELVALGAREAWCAELRGELDRRGEVFTAQYSPMRRVLILPAEEA